MQYKGQFIGVTIASALALAYTYVAVASAREVKLLATRYVRMLVWLGLGLKLCALSKTIGS